MLTANPIYKSEHVWLVKLAEFNLRVIFDFLIKKKNLICKTFLLQISTVSKNVDLLSKCLKFLLRRFDYYITYLIILYADSDKKISCNHRQIP